MPARSCGWAWLPQAFQTVGPLHQVAGLKCVWLLHQTSWRFINCPRGMSFLAFGFPLVVWGRLLFLTSLLPVVCLQRCLYIQGIIISLIPGGPSFLSYPLPGIGFSGVCTVPIALAWRTCDYLFNALFSTLLN